MSSYIAVIRKSAGTEYWADIPDLPGCVSRGKTVEAAKANLQEALALHLETAGGARAQPRSSAQMSTEELEDAIETFAIEF